MNQPKSGDRIAPFSLPSDSGGLWTFPPSGRKAVVVYFYPKDNTPGCTSEAIDFSAALASFDALGVEVVGISADSIKKHQNFKSKHGLTIPLLADETHKVLEQFDVWKEKKMYGRTFMGIERSTFLIDNDGTILANWPKVKVKGHVDEVLRETRTRFTG